MGLTKSEAIANHRKMWNWIADETMKRKCKVEKWDYFKAHGITDIPLCECYCCEYARDGLFADCSRCPIDWGGEFNICLNRDSDGDGKGLFTLWCKEPDYVKSAELAKRIAELPERKYGGDFSALLT